ncbi:8-oxo-dGTP diphosphatase [Stygiolobus caldivivus]|uniref:7,8-dihydro-8-oxoguanine triphosphatase n=1 Tax=Stygiolobus caldivivus TaxID=2824673 RepID=A0A8D5U4J6_9CREN|nr:NUDIX domain-containing protein [Stygiolobus caldivivus]BCU69154.1 7,8-dihydro-8-oxoguanine triphosphatase [Stygiolobus caldivivus]
MKETCLGIVRDGTFLLFIRKLRGLGKGLLTFPGGKVEEQESPEECVKRELWEEVKITALKLEKVAEILFRHGNDEEKMYVYVITDYTDIPTITAEALPMWLKEPIYEEMWADDKVWLPRVLAGQAVCCEFNFSQDWSEFHGGECRSCKLT